MADGATVAIMGAGSWGTAFAQICHDAGERTVLWARRQEVADEINRQHTNEDYLPGTVLPEEVVATSDAAEALDGVQVVVIAIPSIHLESQLDDWSAAIPQNSTLVSLIKGVEVETQRFGSQIITDRLDCEPDRVVVVSGPNLAKECADRLPAATVAASPDPERAGRVQGAVMTPYFRVYTNPDKVGVEIGGAVKNVIALAAGIAQGMGFGDNTKATVITRGLAEMQRLGVALGGDPLTFSGLAGVGDLVATCTSPKSRNRTVGEKLGQGMGLDEIVSQMNMVAEGVKSSQAIVAIARDNGVEMPISEGIVRVVHDGLDPRTMVKELMSREAKPELYGIDR
ncbi:MAG: NAD(P)H-dependent glycerol-3-phosphate dehydrogenase [Nitriliruptorales bacterium]|nr:NAD(P)H-dependent glycerol-3-phosphate dehydrogenase [Nitriliruptorales bacterium]